MPKMLSATALATTLATLLTACGGSDDSGATTTPPATTYTVGGSVSGLNGTLSVQNNAGDTQQRSSSGAFTFANRLNNGAAYAVTLSGTPLRQECTVANGNGTIASADVTNVALACRDRVWEQGQALEADDNPVSLVRAGMADDGTIIAVFVKSNGSRNVLYATRGTPNTTGAAPVWSTPTPVDNAGAAFQLPAQFGYNHLHLSVAGNGRAVVAWVSSQACTTSSYRPFTGQQCGMVFAATYDAANAGWGAPVQVGETPSSSGFSSFNAQHEVQTAINSNGDAAILYAGWQRSGTSSWTYHPTVAWRAQGQSTYRTRLFTDLTPYLTSIWPFSVAIDNAGNMTMAGNQAQTGSSGDRDVIAYRGVVTGSDFSGASATILDQRGTDAEFIGLATTPSAGEAVVVWRQDNGTADRYFSARSTSVTGAWGSPIDVATASTNDRTAVVSTTSGGLLHVNCSGFRWAPSGTAWSEVPSFPANCGRESINANPGDFGYASDGSYLLVRWTNGLWLTYDGTDNVMAHAAPAGTAATSDYVLGTAGTSGGLFDINTADGIALLAPNGIGAYIGRADFDQLPTTLSPNGDGRTGVTNLWGIYLK